MDMISSKIFFTGDFVQKSLSDWIASDLPITAVFGDLTEAPGDCDFIFVGNKAERTIEMMDLLQTNTIRIKVEHQCIEDAAATLLSALYGDIFVGMDWQDVHSALSGEGEPATYLGGLSEDELFQNKTLYEKAKGLFLYALAPKDSTLEGIDKATRRFSDFLSSDVNFVWTFSFDENLKDPMYSLFVKNS